MEKYNYQDKNENREYYSKVLIEYKESWNKNGLSNLLFHIDEIILFCDNKELTKKLFNDYKNFFERKIEKWNFLESEEKLLRKIFEDEYNKLKKDYNSNIFYFLEDTFLEIKNKIFYIILSSFIKNKKNLKK